LLFGPVWSRRFGWSLGVNQFPEKLCTYSCPYCQLGSGKVTLQTLRLCDAREFHKELMELKADYDVITFVPKGEPLLDTEIWKCADIAKIVAGKTTVLLTNGSLLFDTEIRFNASRFDIVSLKVDAGSESVWKRVNAPHRDLTFEKVIEGMKLFAHTFEGKLVTETMLIKGINDDEESLKEIAYMIKEIRPSVAFIMVPTRPPMLPVMPGDLKLATKVLTDILGEIVVPISDRSFNSYPKNERSLKEIAKVHPVPKKLFEDVPKECSVVVFEGQEFVRC